MTDEPQKRFIPNPQVEALLLKATNDPRLTERQRENVEARLRDLARIHASFGRRGD